MSDDKTFWSLLGGAAQREPNRRLLADAHGRSLTARELHDAACATAAAFAEGGIGAGTTVSWQLPTTLETMVVMAALARLGAPEVLDHTVGAPVPGVSVRVVDNREIELPVGHEGELRLKGPQCFLGYADATLDADAFDQEGWLRTGDLGLVDASGNVRVTGRIKDAIIRNAENVSALEIENVLATHPAVADVAVIGVPDRSAGERVCAVVVPASSDSVSLKSLVQHCRSRGLSRYKYPEHLVIVDALPRNQFGKVIKKDLRETFG